MKTILVLTDLSKKAEHAALQALRLAEKMKANILLFNSFSVAEMTPAMDAGMWSPEVYTQVCDDSKEGLENLAQLLKKQLAIAAFHPQIDTLNSPGALGMNVHEIVKSKDISLVVLGAREHSKMAHFLFGSTTRTILRQAASPVLFIPENKDIENIKRIVFATDLEKLSKSTKSFLTEFAHAFRSEIVLVHVTEFPVLAGPDTEEFLNQTIDDFKPLKIKAKMIGGENVEEKLGCYAINIHADLIMFVHRKNSFMASLILGSHCARMLDDQRVPLLILPE